jgi:hypothetical protein
VEKLSNEQEMARHSALLRRMLHDYPARQWKIEIDGEDISGRYVLWEAMNIRSVGPALHLAPRAATKDGRFDFVCAGPVDCVVLMEHFDARVAGKKSKSPLPTRRFRELRVAWKGSTLHLDDKLWPEKKQSGKSSNEIKITVKLSALIILQPAAAVKIQATVSRRLRRR